MEWVWRTDTSWEISLKFSKNGRLSGYTPHLLPSPASPMECIEAKNWRQQCRVAPQTSGQLWMMFNLCLFHTVNIYIYIYIYCIYLHIYVINVIIYMCHIVFLLICVPLHFFAVIRYVGGEVSLEAGLVHLRFRDLLMLRTTITYLQTWNTSHHIPCG